LEIANVEAARAKLQAMSLFRRDLIEEGHDKLTMLERILDAEDEKRKFYQLHEDYENFEGDTEITSHEFAAYRRGLLNPTQSDEHAEARLEPDGGTAIGNVTDDGESNDSEHGGSIPSYHGLVRLCYSISIVLMV
jgi:hypothetical protein